MAENKSKNPTRLSKGASYTIGGKKYTSDEITSVSRNVHIQQETYRPNQNTQATVQVSTSPYSKSYKPSESTPIYSAPNTSSQPDRNHIQTGSQMSHAAQNRVQAEIEYYNSSNVQIAGQSNPSSIIDSSPRVVQGIKTTSAPEMKTDTYRPNVSSGGTSRVSAPSVSSPSVTGSTYSRPSVHPVGLTQGQTANIKTGSEMYRMAENSVQGQTSYYHSGNAYEAGITGINNSTQKMPENVNGIQTQIVSVGFQPPSPPINAGIVPVGVQPPNPSSTELIPVRITYDNNPINAESIPVRVSYDLSMQQANAMRTNIARLGLTGNVTTGTIQQNMDKARAFSNVKSAADKVNGIRRNQLLSAGRFAVNQMERGLLAQSDLGTQSAGMVIKAGKTSVATFRAAQTATELPGKTIQAAKAGGTAILHSVNAIKTGIRMGKNTIYGLYTGKIAISHVMKSTTLHVVRGGAKFSIKAAKFGFKGGMKLTHAGLLSGASAMMGAEDYAVQGLGYTIKTADIGIKTSVAGVKTGTKVTGYTVKTAVKGGKAAVAGVKFIKNNGLRSAWNRFMIKVRQQFANAGKSFVNLLIAGFKNFGKKIIVPLLIISIVASAIIGGMTTPLMAVESIFSGIFSTSDGQEYDVRDYVTQKVPGLMEDLKKQIQEEINKGRNGYDIVRFVSNVEETSQPSLVGGQGGGQGQYIGRFKITAYCPCKICCGKWSYEVTGRPPSTASGATPVQGVTIAVDKNQIPLGTKVFFNNHVYTAQDTGSGIGKNCIDLYFSSHRDALQWGVKYMDVYYATGADGTTDATTDAQVVASLPTNDAIINAIQPMFNAIVLMKYDLEPTEEQANQLIKEIFDKLFKITSATSTEYCGQSITDGTGSVTKCSSCGQIHALTDCPKPQTGKHTTFTCNTCDSYYYICKGHQGQLNCTNTDPDHVHKPWKSKKNPGCYATDTHLSRQGDGSTTTHLNFDCGNSKQKFKCAGYSYCGGHSVITYTLSLEGAYALEEQYFIQPIDQLSSTNPRTDEQEEELSNLKDYYEIYQEMMSQVSTQFSGGMSMSDLSNVNFVNGTRVPNQAVVDLALTQVGQQGGQPYWSYFGFQSRVSWCACFVNWCMRHTPSASPSYPTSANNAYCPTLATHFQAIGQFADRTYTNLVPGDVIFFDYKGQGEPHHVGIVIGRDDTTVYTVEGNSSDSVRVKSYPLGSAHIYGYGLMNY